MATQEVKKQDQQHSDLQTEPVLKTESVISSRPSSSSSNSGKRVKHKSHDRKASTGDEPRALKKRVKQERRSKSADFYRRKKEPVHASSSKSKDDLDYGNFTVIGRPSNPWGDLKRNKSEPCLIRKDTTTENFTTEKNPFRDIELSKSTPDLRSNTPEEILLERKRSTYCIYIKGVLEKDGSSTPTLSSKTSASNSHLACSEISRTQETTENSTHYTSAVSVLNIEINEEKTKYCGEEETDQVFLDEQEEALTEAYRFQKNCEDLLEDISQVPATENTQKNKNIIDEENISKTVERIEETLPEDRDFFFVEEKHWRREILIKSLTADVNEDLHDQYVDILKDFVQQLLVEKQDRTTSLNIKFLNSSESDFTALEKFKMYKQNLQNAGLGMDRYSSMPEMTRAELEEKNEEQKQKELNRNNSLTNLNQDHKKRVIKTKVSSRLLQSTAASQRKQKERKPYIPPAKRSDPTWTDRPMKNVDSGYTSQTFVKYYDPEKPRNLIQSDNVIHDSNELIQWNSSSPDRHEEKIFDKGSAGDIQEHNLRDHNNNVQNSPTQISYKSSEYLRESQTKVLVSDFTTKQVNKTTINGRNTTFASEHILGGVEDERYSKDLLFQPFTTFAKQGAVFASVSNNATTHESKTFQYVYTIDAELSYREYNKLMNIINLLQEQKKKWEDDVAEARDKLEKIGKEKMQLAHNNHILRQSLEAANKAIKEINGKVQELKQTLVPLREDNATLRHENEELKARLDVLKKEKLNIIIELKEQKKMKMTYEEKMTEKDTQIEDYKVSMHEKFKKLEEAYRHYRGDMEVKHQTLVYEVEDTRNSSEYIMKELEHLKKENAELKDEIEEVQHKKEKLESDLIKKSSLDEQLANANKETKMLSANAEQLESIYMKEVEKASIEIEKARSEIEKYKEDTRELDNENDRLKYDLENLENRIKDLESTNEANESAMEFENQQKDIMKNEVEELKKQLINYGVLKQEKLILNEEKQRYKEQTEALQNQILDLEKSKRESFINQHENQRLKSELERVKMELENMKNDQREQAKSVAENQKLKAELQNLRQQLALLEDKQKFISSPFNDEIKVELETIRNQMKDLSEQNQERKMEIYTDELKGELESLRNQIKDLDSINRQTQIAPTTNTIIRESASINTVMMSEKERISEKVIYIKDAHGNLRETNANEAIPRERLQPVVDEIVTTVIDQQMHSAVLSVDETETMINERQVQSAISEPKLDAYKKKNERESQRSNASPFVMKSSELSKRKRSEETNGQLRHGESWLPKEFARENEEIHVANTDRRQDRMERANETEEEKQRRVKEKQIEDRIRRKREQQTDWQLRTPDILKMKRESMDDLNDNDLYDTDGDTRRRNRSRSAGRRAISADPKRNRSLDRNDKSLGRSGSMRHRERGRSPHRRNQGYFEKHDQQTTQIDTDRQLRKTDFVSQTHATKHQKYAVEINVDNRKMSSDRKYESSRPIQSSNGKQSTSGRKYESSRPIQSSNGKQSTSDSAETSPSRRRRRKEKSSSREKQPATDRYEDSSSDIDDRKPRKRRDPSREHVHDVSADMLKDAMKSRQEQAMRHKIQRNLKTETTMQVATGYEAPSSNHYQPPPKQHADKRIPSNHPGDASLASRSYTLPTPKRTAPDKPKRHFSTLDRGYQTDSQTVAREKEKIALSHSQKHLNESYLLSRDLSRPVDERKSPNYHTPQNNVKSMRKEDSLKLTLQPKVKTSNEEKIYEKIPGKRSSSQKRMSEEERLQVERMEKARQKLLQKNAKKDEAVVPDRTVKGIITKNGVPLQRNQENSKQHETKPIGNTINSKNKFITEEEAEVMFNRALTNASVGTKDAHRNILPQQTTRIERESDDYIRSSTWSDGTQNMPSRDQQLQRSRTMSKDIGTLHKREHATKSQQKYYSSDMLTQDNVEKHQSRSYRDTKIHDVQRRNKVERDPSNRLSGMSNDSLGGFSQITYTTVGESNYGSRYDDYATQVNDNVEMKYNSIQHNYNQSNYGKYFDEREILKHAKNIPKGHSKFSCEKCRELNMRSRNGEPIRYCWERYYPISETTPMSSIQNLQSMK